MAKHGEKLARDKVEELFYRVSLMDAFQRDVERHRVGKSIPPGGWETEQEVERWWTRPQKPMEGVEFTNTVDSLLKKYNLPQGAAPMLADYIISAGRLKQFILTPNYYNCELESMPEFHDKKTETEQRWIRNGEPFLRVYIPATVSLKDAQEFLKVHWPYVRRIFGKKKGQKVMRRVPTLKKERNRLAEEVHGKTRKELDLKHGEYRETKVAKILKNDYGFKVTDGNVKQIVRRQKKHHR